MINSHKRIRMAFIAAITLGTSAAFAQMDVDQADSLNFGAFHKDKKEAVKVWKDDKTQKDSTIKAYEQTATPAVSTTAPANGAVPATPVAASAAVASVDKKGQHYELRERYTLSRSAKTPYSAFYVIESLHLQSAKLCPKGWKKLTEKSEPIEQDFFLYYEIECL